MDGMAKRLEEIDTWCRRREYDVALHLCNKLLKEYPDSHEPLREKAFVHGLMGQTERAIEDWTRVIAIRPDEPCYFFGRAHDFIDARRYAEAVSDLTEVLRLCDAWQSNYYRAMAHLVRAHAYLRLGRPADALADCDQVKDDAVWWVENGLRTKSMMVVQAKAMQANGDPPGVVP
jgi:tetratricopeptide (TPR) repeat protein